MRCTYEYRHSIKECPREALEGLPYCIFHLPEGGKDLSGENLSGEDLEEAYLSEANLSGANLSEANLRYADLSDSNLDGADLSWAILTGADLSGASAKRADFTRANLEEADLSGASLIGTNLSLASLRGANLTRADLRGTELYGAELESSNLLGADLRGARLHGVSFKGVRNIEHARLDAKVIEEVEGDQLRKENPQRAIESYLKALSVYLELKETFRSRGLYDRASAYTVGEWRVRGKVQSIAHRAESPAELEEFVPLTARSGKRWLIALEGKTRWLLNVIYRLTSSYGESASRVLITTIAIVFVYAVIYWLAGALGNSSFAESLYFSLVTFTTVGYGDIVPKESYRLLAASEAFVGAFLMAFFVVVISRKLIR
ncbi:voltage-gated potassium channel [Thermococcus profundus]|uniref:Voltage-gated potassium channel n=1 Tax=Thermococcus profundus TaxID=49899 RepID=A0A2Z2MD63_THEPR|nr:pentapeptide repeat-containing protein [Thermococcus profundus]ASJ03493.1 voltage-gated potassium channel [Thermococcus profundus]